MEVLDKCSCKKEEEQVDKERVNCCSVVGPYSVPKISHQTSGALDPPVAAFWDVIIRTKYTGDPPWR